MQFDVAVAADAAFGAVGLDSDIGTAYVKNLGIADEGMIRVYADGSSNSSIHIYEVLAVGGVFDIFVDGAVSEGDVLLDLFTWEPRLTGQTGSSLSPLLKAGMPTFM